MRNSMEINEREIVLLIWTVKLCLNIGLLVPSTEILEYSITSFLISVYYIFEGTHYWFKLDNRCIGSLKMKEDKFLNLTWTIMWIHCFLSMHSLYFGLRYTYIYYTKSTHFLTFLHFYALCGLEIQFTLMSGINTTCLLFGDTSLGTDTKTHEK